MEQTLVIKKFDRLTPREVYEMLRLRTAVFVVEQECPYQEVDGTDYDSLHVWLEENDEIARWIFCILFSLLTSMRFCDIISTSII